MNDFIRFILSIAFFMGLFQQQGEAQLAFLREGKFDYLELFEELDLVQVGLISEEESIQEGRPFWIGVQLDIAEKWYSYWKNPGEGDFDIVNKMEWDLPEGFFIDSVQWPFPKRIVSGGLVHFVHEGRVTLLARIFPPSVLSVEDKVDLAVKMHWFAYKDKCVPGISVASLSLPVTKGVPAFRKEAEKIFSSARGKIPQKLWDVKAEFFHESLHLRLSPSMQGKTSLSDVYFYPENSGVIDCRASQYLMRDLQDYVLSVKTSDSFQKGSLKRLKGVLVSGSGWKGSDSTEALEIDLPLDDLSVSSPVSHTKKSQDSLEVSHSFISGKSILPKFSRKVFVFAFLGGVFLSFMPCTFPIVSTFLLHFINFSKQKRLPIFTHSLLFSFGAFLPFLFFWAFILLFRYERPSLDWGFQLREPLFVLMTTSFFVFCSLAFFDVFPTKFFSIIAKYSQKNILSLPGVACSGILFSISAMPCLGLFVDSSLNAALMWSGWCLISLFACFSIGMLAPCLILLVLHSIFHILPKPGKWILFFRQFMGFLMLFSALWLVWFFGSIKGIDIVFFFLGFLLFFSLFLWVCGKRMSMEKSLLRDLIVPCLALVFFVMFLGFGIFTFRLGNVSFELREKSLAREKISWESFFPKKIQTP